jgi:hypothetical protein
MTLAGFEIAYLVWGLFASRFSAGSAAMSKNRLKKEPKPDLDGWGLQEFIEVAGELKVIKPATVAAANLARDFRNLIHPGAAARRAEVCDRATALSALAQKIQAPCAMKRGRYPRLLEQSSGEGAPNVDLVTSSRNDPPFNVSEASSTEGSSPMSSSKSLSGLMKWLNHDDWEEAFFSVLDQHFKAREEHGLEASELEELLDDAGFANLWGSAFEDFLTRRDAEGRNIVDDYLKRRGWKETATNKRYMSALQHSVMSLYEVSSIVPGVSFLARDLVRGGEPLHVHERSGSRALREWDGIGARLIEMGGKTEMAGGVLVFDRETADELLVAIKEMMAKLPDQRKHLAKEIGVDADGPALIEVLSENGLLQAAAPLFSGFWLSDFLDRELDPQLPAFSNFDGDELLLVTVRYPLASGVVGEQVCTALAAIESLSPASPTFWNWIRMKEPEKSKAAKAKGKDTHTIGTMMGDGSTVVATLELKRGELILGANSIERAEAARLTLEAALGQLVGEPSTEKQTPSELMATRGGKEPTRSVDLSPDEEQAIVHASLDHWYRQQLDEPIPMLGDVSPRNAVKSKAGREKVVAWLKRLDNHMAHMPPDDPMASYETLWLWEDLGVADQRR